MGKGDSRMERMSFALLTMGVSVLAGAITTALSGIMLMFPSWLIFYKMGIIIMTVVIYALLWALVFFTSIMLLIGPEGKQRGGIGHQGMKSIGSRCIKVDRQDLTLNALVSFTIFTNFNFYHSIILVRSFYIMWRMMFVSTLACIVILI